VTSLAQLPAESRAVVETLPRSQGLARRLIALGLTTGAEVRMLQNRGRGPLIVEVHGVRLALGRGQAARIDVEPMPYERAEVPALVDE
jgi:ferrous iron transport protein A